MHNRRIFGGVVAFIGFALSPLSWWNDLFVNVPIAYGFAYLLSLASKDLFLPCFFIGYLLTNVIGFMMMHKGAGYFLKKESKIGITEGIVLSVFYIIVVILLMLFNIIPLPKNVRG